MATTTNLSTLKIHKLSQAQYDREVANGTIDPNALYLTPDEEVDLSLYMTKDNPTGTGSFSMNRKRGTTIGSYSHAEGYDNEASGAYSHAEGYDNDATGNCSHAEGIYTTASGAYSHVEGYGSEATGNYSHAEGSACDAIGSCSHAEGNHTTAAGIDSHAEGNQTTVTSDSTIKVKITDDILTGYYGHAEGYGTVSYGAASHAEGNGTHAWGSYSHTEGCGTYASGSSSHAEGYYTEALGDYSHSEGQSEALGKASHAEGASSASGDYSHSEGFCTTALDYQHAQGHFNSTSLATAGVEQGTSTGTAFVIGNGTMSSASNAFRITYQGKPYAKSSLTTSGCDYAEYFEWQDLNPNAEDRRGYFVTLDGEQIKIAQPNDYILGIVSGLPSIVGNGDEDWRGRYVFDDFGDFVYEDFEYETEVINEETGKRETITKIGKKYKENPEYDPTRPYVHREDRPEWDAVGMMGVLSVRDDGTCEVNGYCKVAEGGTATASESGYRVIKRVNENIVKVIFR